MQVKESLALFPEGVGKDESSLPGQDAIVEPHATDPFRRPTRLLVPPLRVTTGDLNEQGVPMDLAYQGVRYRVVQFTGPERIESGWWQGASERRDYYRLETDRGAWLWLYRDLRSNHWYLHGLF